MRTIRPCLLVLLLTALGFSDNAPEGHEIVVPLKGMVPEEGTRLGYGGPRPLLVEATVPRFLVDIPKFKASDPIYFRVALGETRGVPFYAALDRSDGSTIWDLLYLDRDRDLDLTNDGKPVKGNVRTVYMNGAKLVEFTGVGLTLPYTVEGKEVKEGYACVFYFVVSGEERPKTVQVERDGWREGTVDVGGSSHLLVLVDDDSDGQFTTGDAWILRPVATDRAELLRGDSVRAMVFPSWSEDQKTMAEVKSVDPAGRSVTLVVKPAAESEREFFTKVARARQSPEEQQLGIDPLRPKAPDAQKIDWITGQTAQYALDIAASPNVRKQLVLDFSAPDCVWCDRMNRFTYRDREVVQLSKRFVFAKIEFKKGSAEAIKYGVDGTPTLLILDLDGTEIARNAGFLKPQDTAAWLRQALR